MINNELLTRAVSEVVPKELAEAKLKSGKPIRLYLGIDPTGAKLHLGHSVPLRKLAAFQKAGHHVTFLIGSFTAMIGDPSGRDKQREPLTREQVLANFETYKQQAALVLDFDNVEVVYNHQWLEKLTFVDVLNLASHFTLQQMEKREMFQRRKDEDLPLGMHEFLYPLMQGYDSVQLDVD
ncbi:tyrosine--tRNA ligase, partial [Candidatus Peregrinibacteria bacterium]|nr:tyrosine--tRNA ligase [Candidatus Peregrinibacteria bacterium]